jgi:ribose 5-phosphate isomerase B
MKVAIGADHRGYEMKEEIIRRYQDKYQFFDCGAFDAPRSDYPIFAHDVAHAVQSGKAERGILLCGSGTGMAIVANRYEHIYAAVVWSERVAKQSREHDNINILVLPCDYFTDTLTPYRIIDLFFSTVFLEGQYKKRIEMIDR